MKSMNSISSTRRRTNLSLTGLAAAVLLAGCAAENSANLNSINHNSANQSSAGASVEKASADMTRDVTIWPQINSVIPAEPAVERKVAQLLAGMTLQQKVAQMIQPEIRDITVEDMRQYGFGSYLNGGGSFPGGNKHATVQEWIDLAEQMYQASVDDSLDGSTIPTMWGTDAVHGHNNVIGATLFPHNIGLGATNNPDLIEKIAKATATEVMVTGIDWVFAPTVATVRNDRWGRTYESYSEDPRIVKEYSSAIVRGLQGVGEEFLADDRVISTVKHFVGDGGTVDGDDQGDNIHDEAALFNIHAQGYVGGLTAGSQSVMASFNSWHGEKIHGNKYLLTDVLKERMGFDGFVVGDWNGHGQIAGCSNDSCSQAVNAGLDMFMAPTPVWKPLLENTIKQVQSGEIPMSRIDDAVTRILRVKVRAGLFDKPSPAKRLFSGKTELIGSKAHRDIARQAVRESLVMFKNQGDLLPLNPSKKFLIAGDGADNIGKQSGGWTITWQGTNNVNADFPGGTSIYDGFKQQVEAAGGSVELNVQGEFTQKPDVAVVVFGEEPYAEGNGDIDNLEFERGNKQSLALLKRLQAQGIPVVSLFITGRPMWVNPEINASDAFVVAWLPGSEGAAVADVLLTNKQGDTQYDFTGRLSFSWPNHPNDAEVNYGDENYKPLFAYAHGLSYGGVNVSPDILLEEVELGSDQAQLVIVFERSLRKPWSSVLKSSVLKSDSSAKTQASLTQSMQQQAIRSNTVTLDGVKFRTIDRNVQEDAFNLQFTGTHTGNFVVNSPFREDLRGIANDEAVLLMTVRVNQAPTTPVWLGMNCANGFEPCTSKLNIAALLSETAGNDWQSVAVPLACFSSRGLNLAEIFSPFGIQTQGELNIDISHISIGSGSANNQMNCR